MTATHFAWGILGLGDYLPPEPRRGERFGPDDRCWLCGGPTSGVGWPWQLAVAETFTNHTLAACPTSQTICQPCAAFASKATWERYAAERPELGLKTGHAMSWRCYSHLFVAPEHHECPTRARWRELLLDPPEPPFLAIVAESGQKHLIFRGRIARSRDVFPVQFEERSIWLQRAVFADCLIALERLYTLGFSKDSILSGRYHQGQMHAVGLRTWRQAEEALAPYRHTHPLLLALVGFVAQKQELEAETVPEGLRRVPVIPVSWEEVGVRGNLRQPQLF